MKYFLPILLSLLLFVACSPTKSSSKSGSKKGSITRNSADNDGLSIAKAIVIEETSEFAGVAAEYAWLRKNYPGYQSLGQALLENNGKRYDRINIVTSQGEEKSIYFNIDNFFGKF